MNQPQRAVAVMQLGPHAEYNILEDEWAWSADDRARIIRLFTEHDMQCSDLDAYYMWADHSVERCANWLTMPSGDDDLWRLLQPYYRVE